MINVELYKEAVSCDNIIHEYISLSEFNNIIKNNRQAKMVVTVREGRFADTLCILIKLEEEDLEDMTERDAPDYMCPVCPDSLMETDEHPDWWCPNCKQYYKAN